MTEPLVPVTHDQTRLKRYNSWTADLKSSFQEMYPFANLILIDGKRIEWDFVACCLPHLMLFHVNHEIRIPSLSNRYFMESKSQVIQAVTFSSLVGGHLTIEKGHLTIPKRSQRIARRFFFSVAHVMFLRFLSSNPGYGTFRQVRSGECGGGLSMMLRF